MDNLKKYIETLAGEAKAAGRFLRNLDEATKNRVLSDTVKLIKKEKDYILKENAKDLKAAKAKGLSKAMIDRLVLNDKRLKSMCTCIEDIIGLPDLTGEMTQMRRRPNGIVVGKKRVPIGVIGIIYESRPNVTSDTAALCLKSGNAVILKGGSESIYSNRAIFNILQKALEKSDVPPGAISFVDSTDRAAVKHLLKLDRYLDLIIPRGGPGLIREVVEKSKIPVIKHDKGLCHIYVDIDADLKMALEICVNAKIQKPGVCNAVETILVHKAVAAEFLPELCARLAEADVQIRGCPRTKRLVDFVNAAKESDWHEEYLDLIVAVKVVDDFDGALNHIEKYSSMHSEGIVTDRYETALKFVEMVDSSCVFVNASTRFADGYEFGLGAEMGISTSKLHARGPMGLESLSTYRWVVLGNGQIRT